MLRGRLGIHVLAAGDTQVNDELSTEHAIPMLFDENGVAAKAFGIAATPSAIEVDGLGRVGSSAVAGGPAIEALIRSALKRPAGGSLEVRQVGAELPVG
jgi:hypothetical protein